MLRSKYCWAMYGSSGCGEGEGERGIERDREGYRERETELCGKLS